MGDLVSHEPGRVTACSLSGEGRKVNPCTTTRFCDGCQCQAVLGVGGRRKGREENMAAEAKRCSETQWTQQDVEEGQLSGSSFFYC